VKSLLAAARWALAAWTLVFIDTARAEEPVWELRGEFLGLKEGDEAVARLRLPGGEVVEVPLEALSAPSRARVKAAAERKPAPAAAPASPPRADLPEPLKQVEASAAGCRTAAEAADVYRLFLAGEVEDAAVRAAAEKRLADWRARAERGAVRLGSAWVSPAEAEAAARAAEQVVNETLTLVRLGNVKPVRENLEKASRADANSGRADFLQGLLSMLVQRADMTKVQKWFAEVVAREPDNGAALNNLAVCEWSAGRFDDALGHFGAAADRLDDTTALAANLALVINSAGNPRSKLSDKQLAGFVALYRRLVPEVPGQPAGALQSQPFPTPAFLSPYGRPVLPSQTIADLFVPPADRVEQRVGAGIVVAPQHVIVAARVPYADGPVFIREAGAAAGEAPAELVAEGAGVCLLKCETLAAPALALAASVPAAGSALVAIGRPQPGGPASPLPGAILRTAFPDAPPGWFVHTAPVSARAVGGPLVDASGRVIGVSLPSPRLALPGPRRSFGFAIDRLWPFLDDHLPDLEPGTAESSPASWDAVAASVSRGVVTVIARPAPAGPR